MFYEEKLENGELYFRSQPNGRWQLMTPVRLLEKLLESRSEVARLEAEIEELRERFF